MKSLQIRILIFSLPIVFILGAGAAVQADIFEGTAVGGFMGLVFGDDVDDVVDGAIVGGVAGGVAGAVSRSSHRRAAEQEAQRQRTMQQQQAQQQRAMQQQQAAAVQQAANTQQQQEQALIQAVGEDNYRGLVAMINCEHERAEALAGAGETSGNSEHKLASLWLRAIIANDLRQSERKEKLYKDLIAADSDIDTAQQAGIEADKVLMDIRQERREKNISCRL